MKIGVVKIYFLIGISICFLFMNFWYIIIYSFKNCNIIIWLYLEGICI